MEREKRRKGREGCAVHDSRSRAKEEEEGKEKKNKRDDNPLEKRMLIFLLLLLLPSAAAAAALRYAAALFSSQHYDAMERDGMELGMELGDGCVVVLCSAI